MGPFYLYHLDLDFGRGFVGRALGGRGGVLKPLLALLPVAG